MSSPTGTGKPDDTVRLPGVMRRLERATIAAESPIRRIVGSGRLNPLPHAGTISVFLLGVVTLTGLYLTFFFEFGFTASYGAVAKMEAHAIQHVVRGVHRFASAALVLTTLVHAWRTFVMKRFSGPRRWRWVTGSLSLVIVWLAGVTGYWLIWDARAQALTEAVGRLVGAISAGWETAIANASGTGWGPLLAIWAVHLALTVVVGYTLWRHLRRTRHAYLPPKRWMWLMIGALVVASIAFPAGMLAPYDATRIPGAMPLDPFVMFLLPPMLQYPWLTIAVAAVAGTAATVLPWMLRRSDPPVAQIVADRCTGCELCVVDCPYLALSMTGEEKNAIAVVDPSRCVGCGICVGSCSFGAIEGFGVPDVPEGFDGPLVLACARHLAHDRVPEGTPVLEVACTGVLNPRTVASLIERGATSVQIVGCPPGDCAYGSGNVLTSDRFEGRRRPLLAKAWTPNVSQDWVSPAAADLVVGGSTGHTSADVASAPPGWTKLLPVALVVMASVVGIRFATNASFAGEAPDATVRVIVDHRPGAVLEGHTAVMGGTEATIVVTQAGIEVARRGLPAADPIEAVVDIPVTPAAPDIQVTMVEGSTSLVLGEATVGPDIGRRLVLRAIDRPPPPDAIEGEKLFNSEGLGENLGCEVCHSVTPGEKRVGPSLAGIANTAATRVPGMSAEDYIRQSILDPNAYVVPGFPANQMLNVYSERLTPDQIDALVAYLMTLTGPAS